jgi:hypothetical protein
MRTGLSPDAFWPLMRRFHARSAAVLVSTPSLARELAGHGIAQTRLWSRGIDAALFHPGHDPLPQLAALPGPVLLYVGRVAVEKNLGAFLDCTVPGSKVVVGDGPDLAMLKARHPQAHFTGALAGAALAQAYRAADCFVFPSRTDTFGLVMIEAMACGVPVAAYPVAGPLDVVGAQGRGADGTLPRPVGACHEDLATAIAQALACHRDDAAAYGASYSWEAATTSSKPRWPAPPADRPRRLIKGRGALPHDALQPNARWRIGPETLCPEPLHGAAHPDPVLPLVSSRRLAVGRCRPRGGRAGPDGRDRRVAAAGLQRRQRHAVGRL